LNITKSLSVFNRVTFVESSHTYLIDDQPTNTLSVTGLIKQFKKPFEKEKMANIVAKKRGVTASQIKAEWDMNNLYSTTLGSMLHKYIENFYNNKKVQFDGSLNGLGKEEKIKLAEHLPILIDFFRKFYTDNHNLLCVKNEIVLGDLNDTKICGMSDLLCYNTNTDQLEILDFKTNKKITNESKYGNLLFPFDDMSVGELNEYTIQLNVYKYFIEKYTDLKIDKLKIVWFNSVANDSYKVYELQDIQTKVEQMFEKVRSTSLSRERYTKNIHISSQQIV
jgi:hypothetical protein